DSVSKLDINAQGKLFFVTFPNFTVEERKSSIILSVAAIVEASNDVELCYKNRILAFTHLWSGSIKGNYNFKIKGKYIFRVSDETEKLVTPFVITSSLGITLSVLVFANQANMASFQVLPLSSWGKSYVIVTLNRHPTVYILSQVKQRAHIDWRCSSNCSLYFRNKPTTAKGEILLESNMSLTISFCSTDYSGNLTGTKITAEQPIGVIAGNCITGNDTCVPDGKIVGDMTAEMALPVVSFGKEFIAFKVNLSSVVHSVKILIVSLTNNTQVVISTGIMFVSFKIPNARSTHLVNQSENPSVIKSNYPIQVMLILTPKCLEDADTKSSFRGVAVAPLLPSSMYYNEYFLSNLSLVWPAFVVMVKEKRIRIFIENKEKVVDKKLAKWTVVNEGWEVGEMRITSEMRLFARLSFGCYFASLNAKSSILHVAGYSTRFHCTVEKTQPSDKKDNDCDGEVDEEIEDGQDDDQDFLIDEDVKKKVQGEWSLWYEWYCINATHLIRERNCSAPKSHSGVEKCQGNSTESLVVAQCEDGGDAKLNFGVWSQWSDWDCSMSCIDTDTTKRIRGCINADATSGQFCVGKENENESCSICKDTTKCDFFRWGENCEKDCQNCQGQCSKTTGVCSGCKAGFKNSRNSCTEACEFNEYGENCRFSCMEKCGEDCEEREFGTCPASFRVFYISVVLFLIFVLFTVFYPLIQKKTDTVIKDEQSATSVNSSQTSGTST
ncbi:multiple epidermal growth factor-like domains protein 10, partial [Biomphalaria pfeifferi]